jgi:hypothetical protein
MMNERFRQLYDTAMVAAGKEKQFETTHLHVAEKFAVLIIQECVDQCEQIATDADKKANSKLVTDAGRMLHEGMWGGAMNCSAQIREHFFGVEK